MRGRNDVTERKRPNLGSGQQKDARRLPPDFNLHLLEIAQVNMNAGFDFARQLTRVKSPSEFFELSAAPPDGHSRQPVSNFLSKLWSALRQAAFAAAKSLTTTSPFRFFFEDGGGAFTSNSTSNMLYPQTFAPLSASVLGGALSFGQPVVLNQRHHDSRSGFANTSRRRDGAL
jgi:hypothetical protein